MASRPACVQVSPIIKGARYSLLLCGILYGMNKKFMLKSYESRERPIREQRYKEEEEQAKKAIIKSLKEFITQMASFINIELPPDFEPPS